MIRAIAETCYGDLRGSIKIVKWVQSFEKAWVEIRTTLSYAKNCEKRQKWVKITFFQLKFHPKGKDAKSVKISSNALFSPKN